jgi:hypothetical protein
VCGLSAAAERIFSQPGFSRKNTVTLIVVLATAGWQLLFMLCCAKLPHHQPRTLCAG